MGQDMRHPNIQLLDYAVLINGKKTQPTHYQKFTNLKEYNDIFSGIQTPPGSEYHIKLKKNYKSVQHPPRSIQVKLKLACKTEFWQLCSEVSLHKCRSSLNGQTPYFQYGRQMETLGYVLGPKDFNKNIERKQYYTSSR